MLQMKNISFSYDERQTLHDISMDFAEGQITGILGANGSGKSTIMKLMTCLLKPQEGSLLYDGQPVSYSKKALYQYRQHVNMVFQNPEQQLFYTIVKDDIGMALENLGYEEDQIASRVSAALEMMDISHLQDRPLQYLSYGQKKRVAIAGMLALQPKYLLLDEPTAGLDPKGRDQMAQTMKKLVQAGTNIIVSSHDMDLMYDCCDYAYLLQKGNLIAQGSKFELFQQGELLAEAGVSVPWIVKLHQTIQTPLAENEAAFFEQLGGSVRWSNH
ncbi:energy-coupling factor ABC transporter ATP-binding protein [Streptococcus panodentis]|uniref:ABC transporter ATP-binding protein n=1 Tax=Streptococcus panodentis TaxID=1581472 RepID=A0ABS5AU00_9STRE|nr:MULTISPECIES: ATP-binding cassette domain-containing protein [Streptococcus]KXT85887.1 ATPase component CbiO of energizing module of cobalt ECF transporter [Streptococcus sp. DD11]MBP2620052.1 ABC transporter ATP-binding protein [Streptococcus panodentis]